MRLGRKRRTIVQHHAAAQGSELFLAWITLDLHPVGLAMRVPWVGEAMRERTIIGEHEQSFGITIQPPGGIDAGQVDEVGQGSAALPVAELAEHVIGLVEQDDQSPVAGAAGSAGASPSAPSLGLRKRRVMRSDSPIAAYFSRSTSFSAKLGGSVHTPSG